MNLLLDGQQRMTTLYGVVQWQAADILRRECPNLFQPHVHFEDEAFAFYQPIRMRDDSSWIDVTGLMQKGVDGLGEFIDGLGLPPAKLTLCFSRLSRLLGILDVDLPVEEVTGADKSLDVVVDIFNRVNSGGTKLSKGDLALAKICAGWPEARDTMKQSLSEWAKRGYFFDLDWLLRSVNTVLTGEAKFSFLHDEELGGGSGRVEAGQGCYR